MCKAGVPEDSVIPLYGAEDSPEKRRRETYVYAAVAHPIPLLLRR